MDTKELVKMDEAIKSLKIEFDKIKYEVHTSNSRTREFEELQKQQPLTDKQAQYLKDNVEHKYIWYTNWNEHDKSSRTLKRDLLRLRRTVSQQLNLLDQKSSMRAPTGSSLSEEDVVDVVTTNISLCNDVSQALLEHQNCLRNLEKNLDELIKEVSSSVDMLSAFKKQYDDKVFKIFTIERGHFPLLRECLYASVQQTRKIPLQSWNLFYKVIGFVQSSRLKLLLAAQPVSDITIIECYNQVQYAYLTIVESGDIQVKEDHWVELMGHVKDQFKHDICSAFTAAELVSAVRYKYRHDNVKVRYACRDVVDFVDPRKRREEKTKEGKTHYCYSHGLRECFEYVRERGIEREEHRPLEIECKREVLQRQELCLGYIGDVVSLGTVSKVLDLLKDHPVAGCMPVFQPDYESIRDQLYCGPTSPLSDYKSMHAINFIGAGKDLNGENKYLNARSSHGENFGNDGNLKVSYEKLMICLSRGHHERYIEDPFLLTGQYIYPKLLSKEEEEEKIKNETR